jgi:hypothetical protein
MPDFPLTANTGERMDPGIANFIMLASMAAQQAKARKFEESKVATGSKNISITVTEETAEVVLFPLWLSVTISNDSTTSLVYYAINEESRLQDNAFVKARETLDIKMGVPIIHRI